VPNKAIVPSPFSTGPVAATGLRKHASDAPGRGDRSLQFITIIMEYGDKNIIQYNTRVINCEVTHSQRFSVDVAALKDNYYVNAYVARILVMSTHG